MKYDKESIISRKFIIVIASIYVFLIITFSISFNAVLRKSSHVLSDALAGSNSARILKKVDLLMGDLQINRAVSTKQIKQKISSSMKRDKDILHSVIFGKTEDENYFRIIETIPSGIDIGFKPKRHDIVQEESEINNIKAGMLQGIVEPRIFSDNISSWINVYHPLKVGRKQYVLQFMVSASKLRSILQDYSHSINGLKIFIIAITFILVCGVIIVTYIFTHNFSLLINNLARYMKKAADGELDINLNPTADDELNQLALSFNSLIDELKEKTDMSRENNEMKDIFNRGVALLKANQLDDAIAIFKTLTIIKPDSFGSYFNLGVAYAKNKEYIPSLDMFRRALDANPSFEITEKYIKKVEKLLQQHVDSR